MLETLLCQDHNNMVNGFNYTQFLNELFVHQKLYHIQKQHKGSANIIMNELMSYVAACPDRDLADQWVACVRTLCTSVNTPFDDLRNIRAFLKELHELGGLTLWFATEFFGVVQSCRQENNKELTQEFINYMTNHIPYNPALTKTMINLKSNIQRWRAVLDNSFQDRQAVELFWKDVVSHFVNLSDIQYFIGTIIHSSRTHQILGYDLIKEVIEVIDTAIKTVKMSTTIDMHSRISIFKIMMKDFYTVCKTLMIEVFAYGDTSLFGLSSYIQQLDDCYFRIFKNNDNAELYFYRSETFSAQAALFISRTRFNRHLPQTGEDFFMLIHQNSLSALSALYMRALPQPLVGTMLLPNNISAYIEFIEININDLIEQYKLDNNKVKKPTVIGCEYTPEEIVIFYNMPLRSHSSTFQLTFDRVAQQGYITIQFLGESRERWDQAHLIAFLSEYISGLQLKEPIIFEPHAGIVTWTWLLDQHNMATIFKYIVYMGSLSLGYGREGYAHWDQLCNLMQAELSQSAKIEVMNNALNCYSKTHSNGAYHVQRLRDELLGNEVEEPEE